MPTVLRAGPYRLFFYAADQREPMHVHVWRDRKRAKVWLSPIDVAWYAGFTRQELQVILRIVRDNSEQLRRDWYEFFRD